eukprot:633238_1
MAEDEETVPEPPSSVDEVPATEAKLSRGRAGGASDSRPADENDADEKASVADEALVPMFDEEQQSTEHSYSVQLSLDQEHQQVSAAKNQLDSHYTPAVGTADQSIDSGGLDGQALWERFHLVTEDLTTQLCEQLRSILEPTLASKLRGDFRTGKRINMKKVIPYIASGFRKDKIWLRRTKPSKRLYQVMLAIDDSESMVDRGCTRLAMESLVTVARALTQLEVGEIAVVSVGRRPSFLHTFAEPFTDEAGARCVSQFTFREPRAQWSAFLREARAYLEHAQRTLPASMGHEHPQLIFLVTDGAIQEDRARIARLAREARERRQFLVAILVDNSITEQSLIEFRNGKVHRKPFLEDYPIPHYIVLRDVSHLPDVLADALRQWFELLQQGV